MIKYSRIIALLTIIEASMASTHWDYDNIHKWSQHYPMCASDDESPINIDPADSVSDGTICTSTFDWQIDHTKQKFKIVNNGHTIVLVMIYYIIRAYLIRIAMDIVLSPII